jgi:hypothetical protein
MFYLIVDDGKGFRLVDFSDRQSDLFPLIEDAQDENPASQPVILDDKALRAGFLVDGFGNVVTEGRNYLVSLDSL